jgi:hypothetical protein
VLLASYTSVVLMHLANPVLFPTVITVEIKKNVRVKFCHNDFPIKVL